MAKKGIEAAAAGEEIEIRTDNPTSLANLQDYLRDIKLSVQLRSEGKVHTLSLQKPEILTELPQAEAYCTAPAKNDYVVALSSDEMGTGDSKLGKMLIKSFLEALVAADKLPTAILLYNSGVKVAIKGSETEKAMRDLEDAGIPVYACGVCLDFYNLKDSLAVGMVTSMFRIVNFMADAGHIMAP